MYICAIKIRQLTTCLLAYYLDSERRQVGCQEMPCQSLCPVWQRYLVGCEWTNTCIFGTAADFRVWLSWPRLTLLKVCDTLNASM